MRPLLILLLLAFCFHSYASNDTLTRAEIYNYSIGDTFDYRNYAYSYGVDDPYVADTSISYSRLVISNIYWSSDSSTKSIVSKQVYPAPLTYDTLKLENLNGFEVVMDTSWFNLSWPPNYYTIDSLPDYFGQPTNYISWFCCSPGYEGIYFARGLGKVLDNIWGNEEGDASHWNDSTLLVYYSGANGTFGEPYTSFPTSIENLASNNEQIKVYPTLNNGTFTIETPSISHLPLNFFVYDLQGRMVRQFVLNQNKIEVKLEGLSGGVYIWKAGSEESVVNTGKIVIE